MGYNNSISNFKNKVGAVEIEMIHVEQQIPTNVWTQFTNFPTLTGDGANKLFKRHSTAENLEAIENCTVSMHFQGDISLTFSGSYTVRIDHFISDGTLKKQYISEYSPGTLSNRETLSVPFKMNAGDYLSFYVFHNKGSNHGLQSLIRATGIYRTDDIAGDITELDASKLVNDSQPINKVLVTDGNDGFTYQNLPSGVSEGSALLSTGEVVDKILVTDGSGGFTYEDLPTGGGTTTPGTPSKYIKFGPSASQSFSATGRQTPVLDNIEEDGGALVSYSGSGGIYNINEDGVYIATLAFIPSSTATFPTNASRSIEMYLNNMNGKYRILEYQENTVGTASNAFVEGTNTISFNANQGDTVRFSYVFGGPGGSGSYTIDNDEREAFIHFVKLDNAPANTPTIYFAEVASSVVKTSSVQRIPFNTINTNIGDLVQDTDPNYVIFNTAGVYKVTASIRSSKDESGTPVNNSNRGIQLRLYNQFTIPKTTYAGGNIEDRTTSDTSSIITNTFQAIFEVDATDKITVFHTETGNNNSQVLTDSYLTIEKL